jgi:tetratricopeptide (TPR) repeat protein
MFPLHGKRMSIMPLYLTELAPWERKNEYYQTIQIGRDVRQQIDAINNQTKEMIACRLACTSSIIASQERISEGVDTIAYGVERVEEGISALASAFEWGISEVVWQIEQNREVLRSILGVLMAPLDTQAKERRKRAQTAFANGWIDDAEEEFLESAKLNKFDFSIHISLGLIYLFSKIDKTKALSCFESAIKYARPQSPYYTSYALLHKALIKFDLGDVDEAERSTAEAVDLSPDFAEALYQNAQYNAQLTNAGKATARLEEAIKQDRYYCLKVNADSLFDPIREQVNDLFHRLRDEEKEKASKSCDAISAKHDRLCAVVSELSHEDFVDLSALCTETKRIDGTLKEVAERKHRNSYFDFLDINRSFIPEVERDQLQIASQLRRTVQSVVDRCEHGIKDAEATHGKRKIHDLGAIFFFGSFAVPAIASLVAMEGARKLYCIFFCIPVLSQLSSLIFLGAMIFAPSKLEKDEVPVAQSIAIYLFACVTYLVITKLIRCGKVDSEVRRQRTLLEKASPFLEKCKSL